MSTTLRFMESTRHLLLTPAMAEDLLAESDSQALQNWVQQAAELLDVGSSAVNCRLSRLRWPVERSQQLAHVIAQRVCVALQQRGAPKAMYVEIDQAQQTTIMPG